MNLQDSQNQSGKNSKDSRLKYLELASVFRDRASEVDLHCKVSQRICERVAKSLAKEKPKTPKDFERLEYLKDFVLKTSKNNEATLELLGYLKTLITEIVEDYKALENGATLRDKLKFQSDTIEIMQHEQERMVRQFYGEKKDEIGRNTANS